ncbi:MAG: RNA 2'-phosphotransferase, partial [Candidatus Thermoplasmatota archaeon]
MDKTKISKYISYLLRHDPRDLPISKEGWVPLSKLLKKLQKRHPNIDKDFLKKVVQNGNKRFQIKNNKIRALYGHSIDVKIKHEKDKKIKNLYHGTTKKAAEKILQQGLKPQNRNKV